MWGGDDKWWGIRWGKPKLQMWRRLLRPGMESLQCFLKCTRSYGRKVCLRSKLRSLKMFDLGLIKVVSRDLDHSLWLIPPPKPLPERRLAVLPAVLLLGGAGSIKPRVSIGPWWNRLQACHVPRRQNLPQSITSTGSRDLPVVALLICRVAWVCVCISAHHPAFC